MARKLASVQYVHDVWPIEGADRIECIGVLGWRCVAKRGEFAVGDRCVYFEVDSFLPLKPEFEFLRTGSFRKSELMGEGFRLRTQRFRGQLSQGLALPLSILPPGEYSLGRDVSDLLGVRKWEVEERATSSGTILGGLPVGVPKTDETRVQSEPGLIDELRGLPYYVTTKLDGTSMTAYRMEGQFGACGHNYEYADDGKCAFWEWLKARGVPEAFAREGIDNVALQGEFCAPGIQRNPLALARPDWFVFTAVDVAAGRRLGLDATRDLCARLGVSMVLVEEEGDSFGYSSVPELLERARGAYASGRTKEGIVVRPREPVFSRTLSGPLSMKVINNDYLLKQKG